MTVLIIVSQDLWIKKNLRIGIKINFINVTKIWLTLCLDYFNLYALEAQKVWNT